MIRARLVSLLVAGCTSIACSTTNEQTIDPGVDATAPAETSIEDAAFETSSPPDVTVDANDTTSEGVLDATRDVVADVADTGCAPGRERDIWVWGSKIITSATDRTAFFDFAAKKSLRAVYVESESIVKGDTKQLESFIAEASARCLGVELLFGRSQWALTKGHADAIALAKATVKMSAGMTGAKPIGVHFDVEPHTLPEWTSDLNGTANQLLDLYDAIGKELAGTGLRFSVDIPFWLDARNVTRGGVTRPLHEWVIDRVDVATLMDYRDHAAPPDGIIDNATKELDYAGTKKKIVIGVETLCGLDPELVTFCEEGEAAMNTALVETRAAHGKSPAFFGFAVHHYESWRTLKP